MFNQDMWAGPFESKEEAIEDIVWASPAAPAPKGVPYLAIQHQGKWYANDGIDPATGTVWDPIPEGAEEFLG